MTPTKAESLGALSAELLQVMFRAGDADPSLDWTDLATAGALALRGLAATATHADPALTDALGAAALARQFERVMALPAEVVKVVDDGDDGPNQAGFIPVRRH